ncbi:hypothetical protein GS448_26270 [Rhodococcus hoagii]|nr:hypothetical protein [Prescottella equi]
MTVSHANVLALLANTFAGFGFGPSDVLDDVPLAGVRLLGVGDLGSARHGWQHRGGRSFRGEEPRELRELLVRERVSVLNQTPTAFAQLVDVAGGPDDLASDC